MVLELFLVLPWHSYTMSNQCSYKIPSVRMIVSVRKSREKLQ